MTGLLSVLTGALFGAGFFCLLRREPLRLVLGIGFLSHAANLLLFLSGDLTRARPPILGADQTTLAPGAADPLPQALILTAIVIGFASLAFLLALIDRLLLVRPVEDLERLRGDGEGAEEC
jgi:multicomponent Na+:H+ antiporter subunit C